MDLTEKKTAVFIMPRPSTAWRGAEAMWISVAGIASAAKKKYGSAIIVTSDKIAQPEEVLEYPLSGQTEIRAARWRELPIFPAFFRTILSDFLLWKNRRSWKITDQLDIESLEIKYVWEKHDLFPGPGRKLATKCEVPFISYVHAPVVWEASKWGVKRFFWGKWLERYEAACLKKADYVGAVSEEVKRKLIVMGVDKKKIFVSPMAVDPEPFEIGEEIRKELREELNIKDKFAIGWTGSFRSFHGIDHLIRAFEQVARSHPDIVLILVGEGNEMRHAKKLATEIGILSKVLFTGRKAFKEMPRYIAAFDMAIVSADSASDFHYSPLKLREYLAGGKAVLAPNAGEIPLLFKNNYHLKLFEPGNIKSLVNGIRFYLEQVEKRKQIAQNGKELCFKTGTWAKELERMDEFVEFSQDYKENRNHCKSGHSEVR